ncbi:MAG: hypothetical protein Unbinned2819contig1003_2 [Prokaryotic dsDNA virus sp.]|nr:MAG: hypothetical protein Unbinned2819contig1003_2 [Prokaryotic dsDNA virus sp.]|tara:strand:- start:18233 stop:19891 length:1659 start_codon:yes stop_codon:yes gene_type:complete
MATITTRSGKGSPLSNSEVDSNFTNLNTDKVELDDISVGSNASASGSGGIAYANATGVFTYTPPDLSGYLTSYTVTQGDVTQHQAALSITESQISDFGTYLENLSEDTSPQLGGNLDVNGHDIVTTTNADIELDPHGSGVVVFKGNSTKGSGQFKLNCETNSHAITIKGPPHSANASYTLTLPNDDGDANQVLKTDGSGNLSWVAQASVSADTTPQLGGNLDVNGHDIVTTSNGAIDLDPHGSGVVVFKGNSTRGSGEFVLNCEVNTHGIKIKGPPHSAGASYTLTLPDDDGSANQVLKTDGSGNLSWVAQTTAYADSDVDTHLNTSGASSNQVLSWTGSDYSWVTQSGGGGGGGGGLSDVVSDTTPQLGGDLDVNSNSIVSASNGNIAITPNGTGKIVLDGLSWPTSDGSANQVLKTDGSGQLSFVAQSGGGGGASVSISDSAPSSPSSGDLWWDSSQAILFIYYADGSSAQWVKANPSGSGGADIAVQETAPSNPSTGDLWFDPATLKTYVYYNDGNSNQWVQTNPTGGGSGSGGVSTGKAIAMAMIFGG